MQGKHLQGDGTWGWLDVEVDGQDIVVRNCACTWFGGDADPQDNGQTASGTNTRGNPKILGCALPMNIPNTPCAGSPIPKIPWHSKLHIYCRDTSKQLDVELLDLGPAKYTRHGLDLTVQAFLDLGVSLSHGVMRVDYRIIGGAQHIGG